MIKNKSMRKMRSDLKAVSPVIATILLVLVAVASAVAFWAIMQSWQDDQSEKLGTVDIGDDTLTGKIKVAGSTTVYPMMDLAAKNFMNINPQVKITVQGGGSGAGVTGVTTGTADIGMISKAWTDGETYPSIVATTIAHDGVVIIISDKAAEKHGITDAMLEAMETADIMGVYGVAYKTSDDKTLVEATTTSIDTWGELVVALGGTYTGEDADAPINTYQRSEESGTEEGFVQKVMGASDKQLPKFCEAEGKDGNPGMIQAVSADEDGIGFTSYGMAASNSGLMSFWLNGVECTPESVEAELADKNDPEGYDGSRPLVVLTNGAPSGIVKTFIDYILDETNNVAICSAEGYISLYA
ncbi:substrate-binding domain-containing protein [Methanomassiliicoccus luminyensis]|jgi:phosphate transport system substrate-binding protein|uniref:substrate-binding domain-containing protein n=1 Tax=Methanomassiliicoccus luminyensis TaxID=1080712 RepID=UPI00037CE959|nr:substrate-binding domain-containing protein [Methanomassiliicoccus luminyensis]